jgi:hypothetical protein
MVVKKDKKMESKLNLQIRADPSFLDRIDEWRGKLKPIPSRSEAVRRLVLKGMGIKEEKK